MANKNLPRDVFMYLLGLVTLIISAVGFGTLLFQIININFPDILNDYYRNANSYFEPLRYAIASLVIVFPVFIWASWFIKRDISRNEEKRDLKIRKWLLYLIIFATSLVIIGDLITLLNTYLRGEITTRFVLKILSILFIAGSIFIYYLNELRDKESFRNYMKIFSRAIILIVIIGVIFGFYTIGSPQNQRLIRFDDRKISDLQNIQSQITNYWQSKQKLPVKLDDLNDTISGFMVPKDPQTGANYEYSVTGTTTFKLCALFNSSDQNTNTNVIEKPMSLDSINNYWNHKAGNQCFSRAIDPALYPPKIKQ